MSLIVKPIEETFVSFNEYYAFIQDAYAERKRQGIHFVCTSLSVDELRDEISSNNARIYLGFLSECPNEIASSISVAYRYDDSEKYAWFHLVATNDKMKGKGVGTHMLHAMIDLAYKNGCSYVSLITAKKAISAVRFYEKNGFFKVSRFRPFRGGYEGYSYRYQIVHPSKWDNPSYRKMIYILNEPKRIFKLMITPIYRLIKD